MEAYIVEWLNLTFRWLHMIAGIAWIGASFYFVWLENNLERGKAGLRPGIAGDLWAVHGGGFYYLEKYKVAPEKLPEHLHWFKWEAYFTWLTGICLLVIVYYWNAAVFMVDPAVAELSTGAAIGIGVGALVAGWLVYDLLCRTPLLHKPMVFLIIMFALLTAAAYFLFQWLSPRAAYIHIGAMVGTMMTGNVFFVIIPNQRKLVRAAETGQEPNAEDGRYALTRSRHNNYFTLPVLFIMISNHFPTTYGGSYGWATLAGLSAIAVAIRHHFNIRHRTRKLAWILPAGAVAVAALAFASVPRVPEALIAPATTPVSFDEVQAIIAVRCVTCHSEHPTDELFPAPPLNVKLETPEQIKKHAARIKVRVADLKTMPLANRTNMTDEERAKIGAWVQAGAQLAPGR